MTKCLVCGKENNGWLCSECSPSCDKEKLCNDFCVYRIGCGRNESWDSLSEIITDAVAFEIIENLCGNLSEDLKTYYRILYFAKNNSGIKKCDCEFFLTNAQKVINSGDITAIQKNRIRGLLLDVYTNSHDYTLAENMADILLKETELPRYAVFSMAVFFKRTRRYETAEEIIKTFLNNNPADYYCSIIEKEYEDLKKRRDGISKEYIPSGENKEKYFAFLDTLNLSYKKPRSIPKPIPTSEYPLPQKSEGTYFKDFVAFDVETTGIDTVKDSIIELSAVKVKDGKITDTFSELVRPIDKKIPEEVEQLTGIRNDDVISAREIWEVFPDFAKFIGDNVLVGYNNIAFDSKFLVRAGRYSHIILNNKHFDVMKYSLNFKKQLGITKAVKLVELGNMLNIENPQAHRALADAETTAKIYLKLLESEV